MVKKRSIFLQALLFAVFVFSIGLFLGFVVESNRSDSVGLNLLNSEVDLLDEQLRNKFLENFNISCDLAVSNTFEFADRIYIEGLKLEEYEAASKFGGSLDIIHRRLDLLRSILWQESIDLKKECADDYHTVVYLYDYETEDIDKRAEQLFLSRLLLDLKLENPSKILLIPIAANSGLTSVNLVLDHYRITELPVVIIDEETVVDEFVTLDSLRSKVFA
tara:strand:- start:104 stop:760 length:657 start_codon:yes stop_codon:yes gene_type:complete